MKRDGFSGRTGLVLAALGMAIGTGNIWRFPRMAATYEGGTFLIPWLIFLFTWSIPILIAEFTLGKASRRGPIGAFGKVAGKNAAWMGAFIAFTTLMICSYYSVVTGWTFAYLMDALHAVFPGIPGGFDAIPAATDSAAIGASHEAAKAHFAGLIAAPGTAGARTPLVEGVSDAVTWHFGAVGLAALIVMCGVRYGVELISKIIVPVLFLLLVGMAGYVLFALDGAGKGIEYLFTPNWDALGKSDIWIAGLSQSAWSTGAGWGLLLAYGASAKRDEDAVVNSTLGALGNNVASLLAGLFIFPAVFGLLSVAGMQDPDIVAALKDNGDGNTGLAFTYIPFIFKSVTGAGPYLTIAFFGGLFLAALSSLIPMYQMGTRCFTDMGLPRFFGVLCTAALCGGVGYFAASDMDWFITLDWVFGLGLILGGVFVAWAAQLYGVDRFRRRLINGAGADLKLPSHYNSMLLWLIPIQGLGLYGWWLHSAATDPGYYGEGNSPWDPTVLGTYGAGPCVIWSATLIGFFVVIAPWLARASLHGDDKAREWADGEKPRVWLRLLFLPIAALPALAFFYGEVAQNWLGDKWQVVTGKSGWIALAVCVPLVLIGGFIVFVRIAVLAGRRREEAKEEAVFQDAPPPGA